MTSIAMRQIVVRNIYLAQPDLEISNSLGGELNERVGKTPTPSAVVNVVYLAGTPHELYKWK